MAITLLAAAVLSAGASAQLAQSRRYPVLTSNFSVDESDYVCKGRRTTVLYPDGQGRFPVVVYAHGSEGGLGGCDSALETVASYGFVVIAPVTGGEDRSCNSETEYKDLFTVLKLGGLHSKRLQSESSDSSDSPLRSQADWVSAADWDTVAAWGFSMGGKTAVRAAVHARDHGVMLRAIVASHGARDSHLMPSSVDAMFLTSTEDDSSTPPELMREQFKKSPAANKVFVSVKGQGHREPCTAATPPGTGIVNEWTARFLKCSLTGEHCNEIYGGELCSSDSSKHYESCDAQSEALTANARRPVFV